MSGICGIIQLDGRPVDSDTISAMIDAFETECTPGIWVKSTVGLGSLKHSSCHYDSSTDTSIVLDARLDNKASLQQALNLEADSSDARIVIAAYEKWGEDCPEHLLGDFSFAIWDERQRLLFCARDHLGARSFVYAYVSNSFFAFASDVAALLSLNCVSKAVNQGRIADFIIGEQFQGTSRDETFFKDCLRLPAANTLSLKAKNLSLRTYWALDASRELRSASEQDYHEEFLNIFSKAIDRRRTEPEVGVTLSGGLDSGAIFSLAYARLSGREKIQTFSAIDKKTADCLELPSVNVMLEGKAVKSTKITADEVQEYFDDYWNFTKKSNDLFDTVNSSMLFSLFRSAGRRNLHTVLGGIDGDLVTSGNPYALADYARSLQLRELFLETKGYADNYGLAFWKMLTQFAILPLNPYLFRFVAKHFSSDSLGDRNRYSGGLAINNGFASSVGFSERRRRLESKNLDNRNCRTAHANALNSEITQMVLERYNRMGRSTGVEFLQPFLDKELVEYCLALPNEQKFHRGVEKRILRNAMKGILPESVRTQVSHGSSLVPQFQEVLYLNFAAEIEEVINGNSAIVNHYFDSNWVNSAIKRLQLKPNEDDYGVIWRVFVLVRFLASQ